MEAATLEFRHVSKHYPGAPAPAIRDLSFEVGAGEICVLVGPSGCGKTTAMRLVNRMIDLTGGDILLDGRSVVDREPAELRREIGYAIQQIGLFPHQTIAQNIATVPRLLGWDKARVGVARALAGDPPLMLMDEPFGAIDPINRERLQNEFLRLQAQVRKTIVFVTHDIDEAIKMGDRVAVMQVGGVLAQYATPAELLMAPADEFVEDFVGADRALKRLALQRVRDIDLWKAPWVRAGDPVGTAVERLVGTDLPYPLLVDKEDRPLAWLDEDDMRGPTVPDKRDADLPTVDLDDVLRDALADLLQHGVQYGVVTDPAGRTAGVLSIEILAEFLGHEAASEHAA
jgi:osmoprotectant transport system ATP-binding protein